MISKIDKNGNSYGKSSIIIIDKYGKTKVLDNPTIWGSIVGTLSDQTDLQSALNAKQDTLISGTNIKTINGNTLLGSGDLVISPSSTITVGTTPVTSGTDGRIFFQSGGVVQQDSSLFWNNTNKILVIGNPSTLPSTLGYKLSVDGHIVLKDLTNELWFGNTNVRIRRTSNRMFFDGFSGFDWVNTSTSTTMMQLTNSGQLTIGATTAGARLDVRAQGALSTDLILRTRNSADTRNFLVVNGAGDVYNNGAGGVMTNTFYGENVGRNASGGSNTAFGANAGASISTGAINTFFGNSAGITTSTGNFNSYFGRNAGQASNANANSAFGAQSLERNTSGSNNTALGYNSGRLTSTGTDLTIVNNSVFLGFDTRANADNQTNQIVIGYNAIGTGSNSVTLGNTSITRTNLRGQIVISGFASAPTGVEGAIYYDSTTKKHYGFDGTNWNALY